MWVVSQLIAVLQDVAFVTPLDPEALYMYDATVETLLRQPAIVGALLETLSYYLHVLEFGT